MLEKAVKHEYDVRHLLEGISVSRKESTFDVKIRIPLSEGYVLRHYAALEEHQNGRCVKSFRFQRYGSDDAELPLEDISIERDEESVQLQIERRKTGAAAEVPFLKVDQKFPRVR